MLANVPPNYFAVLAVILVVATCATICALTLSADDLRRRGSSLEQREVRNIVSRWGMALGAALCILPNAFPFEPGQYGFIVPYDWWDSSSWSILGFFVPSLGNLVCAFGAVSLVVLARTYIGRPAHPSDESGPPTQPN